MNITIFISILLINVCWSYTLEQWKNIRNFLRKEENPIEEKNIIRNRIYKDHLDKWTLYNTWEFKRKFKNKKIIRDADIYELNYYSIRGLHHSCKNYKGYQPFYMYAKPIIYYHLLSGFTDMNSINRLPHRYIINRKWKNENRKMYKKLMEPPVYTSEYDCEPFNKKMKVNNIKYIQDIILTLEPRDRKLFCYMYDIHTLNKKNTYRIVGELMCCSAETVRQDLDRIKKYIKSQII